MDTEKKLNEFRIDSLLGETGITIQEFSEISEIQKQVRNKRLYSYLMGGKESTDNEGFATENEGDYLIGTNGLGLKRLVPICYLGLSKSRNMLYSEIQNGMFHFNKNKEDK